MKKTKRKVASLRHELLREYLAMRLNIEPDESDVDVCFFEQDFAAHFISLSLIDTAQGSKVELEVGFEKRKPRNYYFDVRSMKDLEKIVSKWEKYIVIDKGK